MASTRKPEARPLLEGSSESAFRTRELPLNPQCNLAASSSHLSGSPARFLTSLRALLNSFLALAICEAKQASVGLAFMLAFGLAAAMLVTVAFGLIVACVVMGLVAGELLTWPTALIGAAVLCFAGSGAFGFLLVRSSTKLLFKATRRQLGGS